VANNLSFKILSRIFVGKSLAQEERATQYLLQFISVTGGNSSLHLRSLLLFRFSNWSLSNYLIERWPLPKADVYSSWLATLAQISGRCHRLYHGGDSCRDLS